MNFFKKIDVNLLLQSFPNQYMEVAIIKKDGSERLLEGKIMGSVGCYWINEEKGLRKIPLNRVLSVKVNGYTLKPKSQKIEKFDRKVI